MHGILELPCDSVNDDLFDRIAKMCYGIADAMLAERSKNAPKADADGWIEWNGGECPVAERCAVEVKLRGGSRDTGVAEVFYWPHSNESYDIIAYRVKVIK